MISSMMRILLVVAIILTVGMLSVGAVTGYRINRDIGGWRYRAQIASDASDMTSYLGYVIDGLEEWEMTEGYCSIFMPSPENDMALGYRSVINMRNRAIMLTDLDPASSVYCDGLDDLRGTLREWGNPNIECYVVSQAMWMMYTWCGIIMLWVALAIYGLWQVYVVF